MLEFELAYIRKHTVMIHENKIEIAMSITNKLTNRDIHVGYI